MNNIKKFSVNKKNNGWLKFLIGAVAVLFLLLILNFFISPIKSGFNAISSPLQRTLWTTSKSSSFFLASLFNGGSLSTENESLKAENQELLLQVASLQAVEKISQAQSDVSVACQDNNFKLLMAKVNGLDNDILSIDKGTADGVAEEMPVINQQKVLIGKVLKVYPKFSQVMLISNKKSTIVAKVQQSDPLASEINGVVKGKGGLDAYLDSVLINNNLSVGDVIMTSATDPSFPKDLLVGKVIKVNKNDQQSFQKADLKLFFDISVDNLFVITNYKR